jgi:hypothetical protein
MAKETIHLLSAKQQINLQKLWHGKLPEPKFDNFRAGLDLENFRAEAKMRTYLAVVKNNPEIEDSVYYYRRVFRNLVYDELKRHPPARFTSLDDNSLRPGQLDRFLIDTKPAEQMMDNANLKVLKAEFIDDLEKPTQLQKDLVNYWIAGVSKEEILRETGLPPEKLQSAINAALYLWKKEMKPKLKKKLGRRKSNMS